MTLENDLNQHGTDDSATRRCLDGQSIVVLYLNFGPYHLARLNAIGRLAKSYNCRVFGLELSRREKQYPWQADVGEVEFEWRTLFNDRAVEDIVSREQARRTISELNDIHPIAVAGGWSHPFHRAAIKWCRKNGSAMIVCSDSVPGSRHIGGIEVKRRFYLEWYKKWLLRCSAAACVSGNSARSYLTQLGVRYDRIHLKYDVVDNQYFARIADEADRNSDCYRRQYDLPEEFFVFPARLIKLKNHLAAIDAYERYRREVGEEALDLVIVGSGPEEEKIDERIRKMRISGLQRHSFVQIGDLARYLGLAECLFFPSLSETWGLIVNEAMAAGLPVITSTGCTAAEHLVFPGRNGWIVDASSVEQMSRALIEFTNLSSEQRQQMGGASREIIQEWDVDDHARSLLAAITQGIQHSCS